MPARLVLAVDPDRCRTVPHQLRRKRQRLDLPYCWSTKTFGAAFSILAAMANRETFLKSGPMVGEAAGVDRVPEDLQHCMVGRRPPFDFARAAVIASDDR